MVIMVLDHVRHFMHADALVYEPTDLPKTTPVLFFTRWITHFCAPAFVLLAGMAIRITSKRRSASELRNFLITRGLWLILIEVIVMRFSFLFNLYFDVIFFQVIWAIGASMIVLGLIIRVPERFMIILCVLLIAGHNALIYFPINNTHPLSAVWTLLFRPGVIPLGDNHHILVMYPLMPWFGVLLLGYITGKWFGNEYIAVRRSYLLMLGASFIATFIILRFSNVYGDASFWTTHKNPVFTLLSFLNCEKYPPSLLYVLMTLGPVYLLLAILERSPSRCLNPFIVFGRVPLFFYIIHFFMIHIVALMIYMNITGKSWSQLDFRGTASFGGITPGIGVTLPYVYVAWIAFVLLLYPLCKWYNEVKKRSTHWLVSYV